MLDFAKLGPTVPQAQWVYYAAHQAKEFVSSLERVADMYMAFLDPANVEAIEMVRGSIILRILVDGPQIPAGDRAMGFDRKALLLLGSTSDYLERYVEAFLQLVSQFNECGTKAITIADCGDLWRNDIAPLLGSARICPPSLPLTT